MDQSTGRGGGSVQPAGGVSPAGGVGQSTSRGGSVQSVGGVVSILCPLAGSMPLAFTQEDFLVTACVRSTTGRYCFHRCLSVHRGGSGQVSLAGGSGQSRRGQVSPATGGGSGQSSWGGGQVSPAGGGGGVRSVQPGGSVILGGVSHPGGSVIPGGSVMPGGGQSSQGHQSSQGGSAKIGQQNEYSLHGGRYASCVHAGGLSCYIYFYREVWNINASLMVKLFWFSFFLETEEIITIFSRCFSHTNQSRVDITSAIFLY